MYEVEWSFYTGKHHLVESTIDQSIPWTVLGPRVRASLQVRAGQTACPGLQSWGQQAGIQSPTHCPWEQLRTKAGMGPGAGLDRYCLGNSWESGGLNFLCLVSALIFIVEKCLKSPRFGRAGTLKGTLVLRAPDSLPLSCIFIFPWEIFFFDFCPNCCARPKGRH